MSKPKMIGHRGVGEFAPENTMPSYELTAAKGCYSGAECDIHETKDGKFILLHDDTLNDTTNAAEMYPDKKRLNGGIYACDLTLEEIKKLTVKDRNRPPRYRNVDSYGTVRVPELKEYLALCKEKGLIPVIEIKRMKDYAGFIKELDAFGLRHGCVIISFRPRSLKAILAIDKDINTQHLFDYFKKMKPRHFRRVRRLGCRGVDVHFGSVNEDSVKMCHDFGLEMNAWEAHPDQTDEWILNVWNSGIDYITVDRPVPGTEQA